MGGDRGLPDPSQRRRLSPRLGRPQGLRRPARPRAEVGRPGQDHARASLSRRRILEAPRGSRSGTLEASPGSRPTDRRRSDRFLSRAAPDPSEVVTLTRDDPQEVELTAELRSDGLVIVSDFHYPGWSATVDGQPVEILKANRAMRGVAVPAGTHHLVFRYQPLSFRLGIVLSSIGLAATAGLGSWAWRGPDRAG